MFLESPYPSSTFRENEYNDGAGAHDSTPLSYNAVHPIEKIGTDGIFIVVISFSVHLTIHNQR